MFEIGRELKSLRMENVRAGEKDSEIMMDVNDQSILIQVNRKLIWHSHSIKLLLLARIKPFLLLLLLLTPSTEVGYRFNRSRIT